MRGLGEMVVVDNKQGRADQQAVEAIQQDINGVGGTSALR
jgi:hypothetical protein